MRIQEVLGEQFDHLEKNIEKFATRGELFRVLQTIHTLHKEVDLLFLAMANRIENLENHAQEVAQQRSRFREDTDFLEETFKNLNIFNLRRKYHTLSLSLRAEEVDPFGFDPVMDRFLRPFFEFLYDQYWRVDLHGIEHVPKLGPALFVGNHSGSLPYDATMLKFGVKRLHSNHRDVRFMVEDFLFHFPFLGSLMTRYGGVRASQDNAAQLLDFGSLVAVFPEGVKGLGKLYKNRYQLARFGRGGFVRLCLRTGAPLLPVAFVGPEEIHPMLFRETTLSHALGIPYFPVTPTFPLLGPLGLIPLPSKWSIHIMEPISFSEYGPGAEKDRALVAKFTRLVRDLIQDTLNEQIKKRTSVWF